MAGSGRDRITLEVSEAELVLISNALNEVCHEIQISADDFPIRLGGSRDQARALLLRLGALLGP